MALSTLLHSLTCDAVIGAEDNNEVIMSLYPYYILLVMTGTQQVGQCSVKDELLKDLD